MNAMTSIAAAKPLDDIRCFLPGIDDAEYALREKLRRHRNVAAAMLATTESPTARQFAWVVNDYVSELIFAPAAPALLDDVAKFCTRAMIVALHAERLELGVIP